MITTSDAKESDVVINMLDWLNFFTIDIIGDLEFRESFNCLQDSQYHDWVKTLHNFLKEMIFAAVTRFYSSFEYLFFALLPKSIIEMQKRHRVCEQANQ